MGSSTLVQLNDKPKNFKLLQLEQFDDISNEG